MPFQISAHLIGGTVAAGILFQRLEQNVVQIAAQTALQIGRCAFPRPAQQARRNRDGLSFVSRPFIGFGDDRTGPGGRFFANHAHDFVKDPALQTIGPASG
jgi:hypothetical protein